MVGHSSSSLQTNPSSANPLPLCPFCSGTSNPRLNAALAVVAAGGCEGTILFDAETKDKEYQLSDGYELFANTTRTEVGSYHCFHLLATRMASDLRMIDCLLSCAVILDASATAKTGGVTLKAFPNDAHFVLRTATTTLEATGIRFTGAKVDSLVKVL
jgi:hypothetical protein